MATVNNTANSRPSIVYRIDEEDRIVWVNQAWGEFALANGAPHIAQEILGTSLWSHIAGRDVEQIYRDLLWRIRAKRVAASLPFRCDSPTHYRQMRLFIQILENSQIEFEATLEEEGPHPAAAESVELPGDDALAKSPIRMCAWCKAVAVYGQWKPLEAVLAKSKIFFQLSCPQITHGICDRCLAEYSRLALE